MAGLIAPNESDSVIRGRATLALMYDVWAMKRTNIYLPDEQLSLLRRVSESRGRPVAGLVRDAVDSWLAAQGVRAISKDEWQARFDSLMARRQRIAERRGLIEAEVARDVNEAVNAVRRKRTARRR